MKELTQGAAIALYESGWWKGMPDRDVVSFQLFQDRLCMPFGDFHAAVERVLKRPIWTHEFAFVDQLRNEFLGNRPAPTFEEIINLLPQDKVILLYRGPEKPDADPTYA